MLEFVHVCTYDRKAGRAYQIIGCSDLCIFWGLMHTKIQSTDVIVEIAVDSLGLHLCLLALGNHSFVLFHCLMPADYVKASMVHIITGLSKWKTDTVICLKRCGFTEYLQAKNEFVVCFFFLLRQTVCF